MREMFGNEVPNYPTHRKKCVLCNLDFEDAIDSTEKICDDCWDAAYAASNKYKQKIEKRKEKIMAIYSKLFNLIRI